MKYNVKKHRILVILVIVIGLCVVGYAEGFRVGSFGIGKVGVVQLVVPHANTDVLVDMKSALSTTKDNQVVSLPLTPTMHQIILSYTVDYPWTKKFILGSSEHLTFFPISVAQNVSGQIITVKDSEYARLKNQVMTTLLPTEAKPLTSSDGTTLWVENNILYVATKTGTTGVIAPEPIIKNVSFYKNRTDAVLFSAADRVFVIETDNDQSHIQNIFPIYKGTDPHFLETDPNFLYVVDGSTLMQVIL